MLSGNTINRRLFSLGLLSSHLLAAVVTCVLIGCNTICRCRSACCTALYPLAPLQHSRAVVVSASSSLSEHSTALAPPHSHSSAMQINIKKLDGQKEEFSLEPSDSVMKVKEMLAEKTGVHKDQIQTHLQRQAHARRQGRSAHHSTALPYATTVTARTSSYII